MKTTLHLPTEDLEWLEACASARKTSRAALLREIVAWYRHKVVG